MTLYQDCSSRYDLSKNMAARGWGLFSLYNYIENFNDLLVSNHWTNFNITLQECFLCNSLSRLFKPFGFVKKHGRQGPGLIFPIYLYRKLKKLLFRNHWTDFNITLQECFLCNPLSRLFEPFGFVKGHATRGRGLFSQYIYKENFKNLLVRNCWTEFIVTWQECCFGDLLPRLFKPS